MRMKNVRPSVRQPQVEQRTRRGIGDRVADTFEQPAVIQQHERQLHPDVPRHLARRIKISEEVRIEADRHSAAVVDDAGAAVGEEEPPRDAEAERRHRREIVLDRRPTCGHAQVRAPDIGAEVEAVIDSRTVR